LETGFQIGGRSARFGCELTEPGRTSAIGGLASQPDLIAELVAQGARYVSAGSDLTCLMAAAGAGAESVAGLGAGR
jgi:2-keto-3-deoxy-L-rhamnonate aldolase RhmA